MAKIDSYDKKIIYELDIDARQSAQQIAKKVRLSKVSVINRINKLVKDSVITEFLTQLNYRKLGYTNYHVYYSLQNLSIKKEEEFIHFIKSIKDIIYIIKIDSKWDIMLALLTKGNEQADEILNKVSDKFGDYIKELRVFPIVRTFYPGRNYLIDKKPQEFKTKIIREKTKIEKLDKIDLSVIKAISHSARDSLIYLKEKTKIRSELIRYHLKKMIKNGVIQRFTINLDHESFGNLFYKVFFRLSPSLKEEVFMSAIAQNKYSHRIHHFMAEKIVEADYEVPDFKEMRTILKSIKEKFGGQIQELEILPIYEIVKIGYNPL